MAFHVTIGSMDTEVIPLSQRQMQTPELLAKCRDSGQALVVELPDHRFVAIQPLDAWDDDASLVSDLIEFNPDFRALPERSGAGVRKPFPVARQTRTKQPTSAPGANGQRTLLSHRGLQPPNLPRKPAMRHFSRRCFLKDSMLATATALAATTPAARILAEEKQSKSPNEKLSVAVLGVRGRGAAHATAFGSRDDCEITYVCEPDSAIGPRRAEQIGERQDGRAPKCVADMRDVFDDPSVDIVVVATPNHWHSLAAIWAMQAGKDVYVEKPVSHNVSEGRRMVQAMEKYNRICQGGTQYRSVGSNRAAAEYIRSGKLGKISLAHLRMYRPRNHMGPAGEYDPPATVDYNLWAGPAPMQIPVRRPHFHYDWHWLWDYGNGELGNNSVHVVDTMRLILGLQGLGRRVLSYGARQFDDAGETPNTQVTIHDFGDLTVVQEVRNLKSAAPERGGALLIEGTEGYMVGSLGSNTVFDLEGKVVEKLTGESEDHVANFIKAVRSRKVSDLNAPIHEGHVSTALVHVANISQLLGQPASPEEITGRLQSLKVNGDPVAVYNGIRKHLEENDFEVEKRRVTFPPLVLGPWLEIDPESETFVDNSQANALLTRDYREPFVVPSAEKV